MNEGIRLVLGLLLSSVIGWLAYRRGSLSRSGVAGAIITGTLIFGLGGWSWGLLLIGFFVSSTVLSHYKERTKEKVAAEKFAKGSKRDLAQALANGGMGALLAIAAAVLPDQRAVLFTAFCGAMATVTADTWATELGVLSRSMPRLIINGKPVPPGTSGGVTFEGTAAAAAGALFIGILALVLRFGETALGLAPAMSLVLLVPAALIGGVAGSLIDSVFGATVQAMYSCPVCGKETEKTIHHDTRTQHIRGWRWMDNDLVNFLSSALGALIAALLFLVAS